MKSEAEKLKSEQCRRILEALESGPKTTDVLVETHLFQRREDGKIAATKIIKVG